MARNGKPRKYVNSVNALVDADTREFVDGEVTRRGKRQSVVVRDMLDLARLAMTEGKRVKLADGRHVLAVPLSD